LTGLALMVLSCVLALPAADLSAVQSEPNLEKRARKALDNAEAALVSAQNEYLEKNDPARTNAALDELAQSVEICHQSLKETGKNPSKSPKHFKYAEIKTRALLRKLTDFREQMSAMDREEIDKARASVQRVHDDLLAGIMGEKKSRLERK